MHVISNCDLDNGEEFGPKALTNVFITDGIKIKAKNSSGEQKLYFNFHDDEYADKNVWATLCGTYRGENIQIDFDEISLKKLKKLRKVLTEMIKLKGK